MQLAPRWLDRNLSRLELIVSVTIILLFIGAFIQHMLIVFARAERSMVTSTVTNINTALKYRAVFDLMKQDYSDLADLGNSNPMNVVEARQQPDGGVAGPEQAASGIDSAGQPGNYTGELENPDPAAEPKGSWYYDKGRRQLVYIVRNTEFFSSSLPGVPRLRFRVHIDYTDSDANGKFDPPADKYRSVHLQSMDHYDWAI